jgi:uncharacterized protein
MSNLQTIAVKNIMIEHEKPRRFIHLLYVPTIYCNLGCKYCYLGSLTDTKTLKMDNTRSIDTLNYALKYFEDENVLPFNLSLHGGEVSAVSSDTMTSLFGMIESHYLNNYDELSAGGFKKQTPHIKTNLFNFDHHYSLFNKHKVSISGSVDLPLSLHEKYRTTKSDKSSLPKIKKNIALLANYQHGKKLSATLFKEHLEQVDKIIEDIWYIHNELKFDMNNFNFMFGFESGLNDEKYSEESNSLNTAAATDIEQLAFYNRMKEEFMGTELEWGFKRNWFDEFTPSYCTNATNCGEKFFLLQSNGDVYSCVRGQGSEGFYYGNIFKDTAEKILANGNNKIRTVHQEQKLHDDCKKCEYLKICNTGCAFVKEQQVNGKSYTCELQKQIYRDNPKQFKPVESIAEKKIALNNYLAEVHPKSIVERDNEENPDNTIKLSSDFYDETNSLSQIIKQDQILQQLYSKENFSLEINGEDEKLISQILRAMRSKKLIQQEDEVLLHIRKSVFEINSDDSKTNSLYLQLLRDTKIIYGDEQREKQEHTFTQQIYMHQLSKSSKGDEWLQLNLSPWLNIWSEQFIDDVSNNLFITTTTLREYHYKKQQKNAFYHIQAINLPFQNFEFVWFN